MRSRSPLGVSRLQWPRFCCIPPRLATACTRAAHVCAVLERYALRLLVSMCPYSYLLLFSLASLSLAVTVTVAARTVTVKGPRGELVRAFKSMNFAANQVDKETMKVDMWFGNRKQLACLRTITTHIENMITGVTKGFMYKMRFAYSHFPINVTLAKDGDSTVVEVRNFLGDRRLRRVTIHSGVKIERSANVKDELVLTGNDLEKVSGNAAQIHEVCLVRHKDIRKFLDGIYVSEKGPIGATVALM